MKLNLRKCICIGASSEINKLTHSYKDKEGFFHCWGYKCLFSEEGNIGTKTIAIVEFNDGTIQTFNPDQIKFLDKEPNQ